MSVDEAAHADLVRFQRRQVTADPARFKEVDVDRINYVYTWHNSMGHYKFLGIRDYATEREIRLSYLRMAKEFHPDLHMDFPADLKQKLNTIFSCINSAYSTLANPEKRREYDRTLGARGRVK